MKSLDLRLLPLDDTNPLYRAKAALTMGDRVEALRCWNEARERLPEFTITSHDSLDILVGLERFDEAEALMLTGRKRFRRDAFYAEGYAEVAARRNDHAEAARRWAAVRKAFPGSWKAYALGAAALCRIGQYDEAEAILKPAVARFSSYIGCRIEHARLADLRKNWPEALRRWEIVSAQFNHVAGAVGAARALQEMGRLDEAEECLAAARLRHPTVHEIVIQQARLAQRRGNEAAERRLWETVLQLFPLVPQGILRRGEPAHRNGEIHRGGRRASPRGGAVPTGESACCGVRRPCPGTGRLVRSR